MANGNGKQRMLTALIIIVITGSGGIMGFNAYKAHAVDTHSQDRDAKIRSDMVEADNRILDKMDKYWEKQIEHNEQQSKDMAWVKGKLEGE